jgi:hypothetical protein
LRDCIFSLKGDVSVHKTGFKDRLPFIEVPVPSQENERACICVLGVPIYPLSTILIFDFVIVATV